MQLAKESGMEVVIVRPPLVYGPGVKANFLHMIKILYAGVPLPLGNVNNKRSLVFIDNLVDLIIKVIDHPGISGEIFLVSDDNDVSTSHLLNVLSLALRGREARLIPLPKSLLKIIFKVLGKSALSDRLLGSLQLDIEKTKNKLDWVPQVSFECGIKITVDSYLNSVH
jgi:nucleoside-diphosphate-sugar epimerase